MADEKIVIEIQLDDGSVVKGLGKIQKATQEAGKGASQVGDQIDKAFSGTAVGNAKNKLDGFLSTLTNLHPALKITSILVASVGVAVERAFAGEEIVAIGKRFELLTSQAGVSANAIRSQLEAVAGGAIDTEELLSSSSKFVVEFGKNAERLPEILNIARKASALFGGEVTANFEQISQAIASGQTRSLKGLGIIIDQEAAYKKFAESIGIATSQLNEAGKKQAILEAVIAKGNETFKSVDPSVNQLSLSFQRLKVQIGETADAIAIKSNSAFGSFFTGVVNAATNAIASFNNALNGPPKRMDGLVGLQQDIDLTQKKIDAITASIKGYQGGALEGAPFIKQLESDRASLNEKLDQMQMRYDKFQAETAKSAVSGSKDRTKFIDTEKASQDIAKLQTLLAQANIDRINSQMALDTTLDESRLLQNEKIVALDEQLKQKLSEIDLAQKGKSIQDFAAYEALKTQLTLKGEADRQKLIQDYSDQNGETVRFSNQYIAQGISNAVSQTVMAVKKGQNAFKAFTGAIFGLIGDMVTQIGTTLIGIGLGMEAIRASIVGLTGGPALFAGVALVALGTLLKSLSGGQGGSSGAAAGSGGVGTTSPAADAPDLNSTKPQSQIAVTIQGDVLDSNDTGLRIVDIIRQYADKNGGAQFA